MKKLLAALGGSTKGFRDDLMSPVRFHRILRRGREYGPALSPADALQPAPRAEPERGLHFICLNANIGRQFEFLQNAWLMSTTFADLRARPIRSSAFASRCPAARPPANSRCRAPAGRPSASPAFRSSSP